MFVAAVPAVLAADTPMGLRASCPLTDISEGNTHYILGAAVGSEWTNEDFFRQINEGGYTCLYPDSQPSHASMAQLATGVGAQRGAEKAVAVVKGDVLGTGTWSLSQLVTMADLVRNADSYARESSSQEI